MAKKKKTASRKTQKKGRKGRKTLKHGIKKKPPQKGTPLGQPPFSINC